MKALNTDILLQEIKKVSEITETEAMQFLALFRRFTIKKGDHFYRAGEIPRYSPFIVKGCMRKYFIDDDGEEHIVYFAEEGWFAGEVQ